MALADLNRSNDTPIPTLKLAEIVPKNFPTFPLPVADMTLANQNAAKPRYNSMTDWSGASFGDDVSVATADVAIANASGGGSPTPAYSPRNQAEKAAAMGTTLAVDVARRRGPIAPNQPYPVAGDAPVAAPVITSLNPNTAVAGTPGSALPVDIIGTGFTVWSTVTSGNYPIPSVYVSPTLMRIGQWPQNSVPGIVHVQVIDHDVLSNISDFTFT